MKLVKPRHKRLFDAIKKKNPNIKIFFHSCGAVLPLIPDLIEIGVNILNPVQLSANKKNRLKEQLIFSPQEVGLSLTQFIIYNWMSLLKI